MPFSPKAPQLTLTNSTTDVDVVDAPSSGTIRMVRSIVVYNADTASATVTLKVDVSATEKRLVKETLAAGESLLYEVPTNISSTATIQAVLAGTVTTSQLEVTATFGDFS